MASESPHKVLGYVGESFDQAEEIPLPMSFPSLAAACRHVEMCTNKSDKPCVYVVIEVRRNVKKVRYQADGKGNVKKDAFV